MDVETARARIRERNETLNAVLTVLDEPQRGDASGPLAGVPYVLKDTWDTAGIRTTGGSWRHRERVPKVSSHAHRAFLGAGAVLLGKSNLCDLAFSVESDNHLLGPVRNPHDLSRTAGGSTGGGAAAVADGMAAFDWGTDFGGSIRGPSAFCGVVGMRLSAGVWPVKQEHFPRIAPLFWDWCGMGPLARDVATARRVTRAVRPALRTDAPDADLEIRRVAIWAPDRAHDAAWPEFVSDAVRLLRNTDVSWEITDEIPTPSEVNALYTEYLASHFREFIAGDELPLRKGLPAVLLGLVSGGRLDKSVHPNTGILLAGAAAAGALATQRRRQRAAESLERLRAGVRRIWSRGLVIVSPTTTELPPKHGRAAFAYRCMSFCKLGNLADATGLALPFGTFPARPGAPPMPRSLQLLGPPGSEDALFELADRLGRYSS
ncbi:MAG TPA: amidase [Labilithrix sp.]|jgi:Asp-tRNA(Asn)/Glu-tRNA(Gln) amidotransferase A subunit family amidase